MFNVDSATKKITLHRGDTGEMTVHVTGYTYGPNDRALFTVKDTSGSEIMSEIFEMVDNAFTVEFANADTDYLSPGIYWWDVRYVIDPQYDTGGKMIDGDAVSTPGSPFEMQVLGTVGQI